MMSGFMIGLIVGFSIGGILGYFTAALMFIAAENNRGD